MNFIRFYTVLKTLPTGDSIVRGYIRRRFLWLLQLSVIFQGYAVAASEELPTVHRFSRPGIGSVNSFVIEGRKGLVVIDAQRSLSLGRALAEETRERDKPLLAILITHPHPDHFGGLNSVLDEFPGTPVYASQLTREEMRTDGNGFMAATRRALPNDTPDVFSLPDHTFEDGDVLVFADLTLNVHEIGPGESKSMSMFYLPEIGTLFTGDLISYRMTGFLLEGRLDAWLQQLAELRIEYSRTSPRIMPGHGEPGEFDTLLNWQTAYLSTLSTLIVEAKDDQVMDEKEIERIKEIMDTAFPGLLPVAAIPDLMEMNLRTFSK
ncbi:MAG: MBL fold metallo-hydrolase [Verrucomicrobiota bacterium]